MKTDYIPKREGDLNSFEVTFVANVATVATALSVPAAEIAPVVSAINDHQVVYQNSLEADEKAKSLKAKKNQRKDEAVKAIRALANRFKNSPGYTDELGHLVGIVGPDSSFDPANAKPKLTVSEQGNNIIINFTNPRETDGVEIWSRRGAEEYKFLARDTESPYLDSRSNLTPGLAEQRTYKAWYFDNDDLVGLESDEVNISITK